MVQPSSYSLSPALICDDCGISVATRYEGERPAGWGGPARMYNRSLGEDYCPSCSTHRIDQDWPPDTPMPTIGETVYLASRFYLDHGRDDFVGGRATVNGIILNPGCLNPRNRVFVTTVQAPGMQNNWLGLMEQQTELKNRFGLEKAHPDPDWDPEFNRP